MQSHQSNMCTDCTVAAPSSGRSSSISALHISQSLDRGSHRIGVSLWSQRLCGLSGWRHCQQRRGAQRYRQCRMRWLSCLGLPPRYAAHGGCVVPRRAHSLVASAQRSAGRMPLQYCLHAGGRPFPETRNSFPANQGEGHPLPGHKPVQPLKTKQLACQPRTARSLCSWFAQPVFTSKSGWHSKGLCACVQHKPGACKRAAFKLLN